MATSFTEKNRQSDWLKKEADGLYSREPITLLSGAGICKTGLVLGAILIGAASAAAFAGNAGDGAMGAITAGAGAKPGVYKLVMIEPAANAGKFAVEDPDGITIGVGTVAVAFAAGGLGFTLADGAADFAAGDGFNITVAAGSKKRVAYDPTGTDGRQIASDILWTREVDATSADAPAVSVARQAIISPAGLLWGAGVTTSDHKTAALVRLKELGILNYAAA